MTKVHQGIFFVPNTRNRLFRQEILVDYNKYNQKEEEKCTIIMKKLWPWSCAGISFR